MRKHKNVMAEKAYASEALKKKERKYAHPLENALSEIMRKQLWKAINQKLKNKGLCLTYMHSSACIIHK